ncbi:hypothetical protein [Natrinema salifodinae]|uniref:Uncharacterized protein n=1 Tax=Natrinema salifodinae TaxID=1202768 RepID=A0A1I0PKS4_9EURY|nr:hypothetical protein [Natrinema salifodinae]SEW14893.1 hypothetical protein SAMN05216285_2669 [Natrinema salifodinae]
MSEERAHSDTNADAADGGVVDTAAFWVSAIAGVAAAVGGVWLFQGPVYQTVLRVRPTVAGGGVGSGWVAGNTEPLINALLTVIHFADVIMGIFIILMVVIHWAAFRRLADRMQPPASAGTSADRDAEVATDGGESR